MLDTLGGGKVSFFKQAKSTNRWIVQWGKMYFCQSFFKLFETWLLKFINKKLEV